MIKNALLKILSSPKKMYALFPLLTLTLILALFLPFELTIAPERKFIVVDEDAKPISAASVKQIWDQYSLEFRKAENININPDGAVLLPKRTVKTRWIDLLGGALGKILEYTINASIGSSDTLIISAFGYEQKNFLDGEGLGKTVVLKRQ
jgi:hypothetical protein